MQCIRVMVVLLAVLVVDRKASALLGSNNAFLPEGLADPGWKFIRGPRFDGHSPEIRLADSWPAEGPPVLWTSALGQGYSAVVADAGRVYTQYQTLAGQFISCFDADTGRPLWERRYDWPFEAAGVYPGPRATPTLDGEYVYFVSPDAQLSCIHASDGRAIWSRDLKQEFQTRGTEFGYSCSPTVIDGLVVMPVGGPGTALVAFNAKTGSTVWQSGNDPASYTPAFPIQRDGKTFIVGYLQNALVVCELATGRPCVRLTLSSGYDEHSAWPLYSEPYLWISGPFRGGSQLLEFTASDPPGLRSVWKKPGLSNDILSSVLIDGAIYGFDVVDAQAKTQRPTRGHFRCIDLLTGDEHWSIAALNYRESAKRENASQSAVPRIGHASVITADGKLFLLNDTGELILASAKKAGYEELGRATILGGEIGWTPPTLHRGRIFARNHSRLVCVYVGRPDLLNKKSKAAAMRARDIPQQSYRDWAGILLGVEPEYAFDLPSPESFRDWFIVILLSVFLPALLIAGSIRIVKPRWFSQKSAWLAAGAISFMLGAIGTTMLSKRFDEFLFTWPACLFVPFLAVVSLVRRPGSDHLNSSGGRSWRSYFIVAAFLANCLAYFLICRRLSLVFEWAFLAGFPAALPFAFLARSFDATASVWRLLGKILAQAVSFSAFYWSSVALLWWWY
jgi:outer membrane protein assembly factor BamB